MRAHHTYLLFFLLAIACGRLAAQNVCSPSIRSFAVEPQIGGREYWVVFQKNFRDHITDERTHRSQPADRLDLSLVVTGASDAHGVVEIAGIGFRKEFDLMGGGMAVIPIDTAAQLRSSEEIEKLAVHVTADQPVLLYGLNHRFQTTDSYIAYPTEALGRSYRAVCYNWLQSDLLAQMAIVATEDGTRVTITPSVRTHRGRPAKEPFTVTLNRGDVYQVMPSYDSTTKSDLTGSLVESDRPVAVFSGHNCAYVPGPRVKACNILCEQMPPVSTWGERFVVGELGQRSSSVMRVVASEAETGIYQDDSLVAVLGPGEFYENRNLTRPIEVTSDRPVLVVQYAKGFDNGDDVGDPMMMVIQPVERYRSAYRMATVFAGDWHHYVNIAARTEAAGRITIDGAALPPGSFKRVGNGEYSTAIVEVPYGAHSVTGIEPFGIYTYGFGYNESAFDAYGSGGMYLIDTSTK